ncbi:hypothetical protein [Neobacillus citreus]|uniref:Uncharacterized protein n=1 Tax=Neobacillus citreus TaxID=2833578 RepID=A0A942SUZ8_9BACI|nr:hypothetical protein [Neobacillus citreus]MCH6266831.1 hypothetical protein [Neobacillus citreus]
MSLKSALFELKEAMTIQRPGSIDDEFIKQIETNNQLSPGTLVFYFNNLMISNLGKAELKNNQKKVNRKWTKNEIGFMFQYIKERQEEGGLNITEILDEVSQLLDRGYQSVNYKYYTLVKELEKKREEIQKDYHFTTITEKDVPVVSTKIIGRSQSVVPLQFHPDNSDARPDLIDILSGLITNVQQLPGINLHELLNSLYQLTNMALQNQNVAQELDSLKNEVNQEKEVLQERLLKKEQQLLQEKRRNDKLQLEVAKLAKEIAAFNQLGDAAKIQNLKSYNQRLNYIIDGFGVVLQVGS